MLIAVLSTGEMAKNKQKGKKQKNVFQVANKHLKNKTKVKPVTTTLKHVRSLSSLTPGFFFFGLLGFVFVHVLCIMYPPLFVVFVASSLT